jgi:hypothetical protein
VESASAATVVIERRPVEDDDSSLAIQPETVNVDPNSDKAELVVLAPDHMTTDRCWFSIYY